MSVHRHRCGSSARSRRTARARVRGPVTTTMVISMTSGAGRALSTRSTLGWCPSVNSGISRCRCTLPRLDSQGVSCLAGRMPARHSTRKTANCLASTSPGSGAGGRAPFGRGCAVLAAWPAAVTPAGSWLRGGQTSVSAMSWMDARAGSTDIGSPGCGQASDNCLRNTSTRPHRHSTAGRHRGAAVQVGGRGQELAVGVGAAGWMRTWQV